MAKRKKKKSLISRLLVLSLSSVMLAASVYFIMQIKTEVQTTFSLKAQISEAEEQLASLQKELESLTVEKEKLSDSNYISSVARSKYLISKTGEQIFVLPPLEDEE